MANFEYLIINQFPANDSPMGSIVRRNKPLLFLPPPPSDRIRISDWRRVLLLSQNLILESSSALQDTTQWLSLNI